MKFYQSLKFRLVGWILLLGMGLVIVCLASVFFIASQLADQLITALVNTEMDYVKHQYNTRQITPEPHSRFVRIYSGLEQTPESFHPVFKTLTPGVHSIEITEETEPFWVGVMVLPNTGKTHYLIFDTEGFLEQIDFLRPETIFLISLGLLSLIGLFIGIFAAKVIFKPVDDLIVKIRDLNPEQIPDRWEGSRKSGELGTLTQTIEATMNRIRQSLEREKQFTRDASHELRTPLTVVKGAVEVMEDYPQVVNTPELKKPMKRIRRSIKDMENLIETFLWLAREGQEVKQTTRVEPMVKKAIQTNEYLIENKAVNVQIEIRRNPRLKVAKEVLYITVSNLIRNAFQFTTRGTITITVEANHLAVRDTGPGIDPDQLDQVTRSHIKGKKSKGFGLGLNIVSRLCDRYGWRMNIDSSLGKGTEVTIHWMGTNTA